MSDFLKQFEDNNYHSGDSADKSVPVQPEAVPPEVVQAVPQVAPPVAPVAESVQIAPAPAPEMPAPVPVAPEAVVPAVQQVQVPSPVPVPAAVPPVPDLAPVPAAVPLVEAPAIPLVGNTETAYPEDTFAQMEPFADGTDSFSSGATTTEMPQVPVTPTINYVPERIYSPAAYEDASEAPSEKVPENASVETFVDALPSATSNPKAAIARTEDVAKKDTNYTKKKVALYAMLAIAIIAFCTLAFGIFFFTQQVEVRDFTGSNISEARTWGIQNRITIEAREVYSLEHDADIVISQNRDANTRINRGSVLVLEVSRGPDMTEHIVLPDFATMTTAEVREWRQAVRALNANIVEEYNDDIEASGFIRYEFTDSAMTRGNYTRADGLLIYMSRGPQTFEANIAVPNFFDRALEEVQQWARENSIELIVEEAAHATVLEGHITEQSVAAGERVAQRSEFTITVSLGIAVTVPDFRELSSEEAAAYPGLEVMVQRRYSASIRFGALISQTPPAGVELVGEGQRVTVVYSLGRPYIDNLIGDSESTLAEYFYNFNAHGASISYSVSRVSSHEPRGSIVWMSRYGEHISMRETIHFHISRGDLPPPAE